MTQRSPDPPVPLRHRPVEQADRVAGLIILTGEWIKAELATRSVEQQIVGLSDVVDAGAGRPGLDHMHLDLEARRKTATSRGDNPLERADAPRA